MMMLNVTLSPVARRLLQAVLFEAIGFCASTALLVLMSGQHIGAAGRTALGTTLIALSFNYLFNWLFETWERRHPVGGRPLRRRILHGVLFEAGLTCFMIPFLALSMGVSLWDALIYDAWLLLFFSLYAIAFTWAFDRIFGLPASAQAA